ncbi:SpoIID/LytB domain-containing protein [uncultured Merdimonas sp.]|uniref:SpoIID/LytB domain-containing protein n=1 Tax=uncultured Merdimonas sp. TaxID=2023269 RepID=UPI0032083BA3
MYSCRKRRKTYRALCYILALGICLLFTAGLQSSLSGADNRTGQQEKEEDGPERKRARREPEEQNERTKEAGVSNPDIRVLLLSTGYQNEAHPEVSVSSASGLQITCAGKTEEWPAGKMWTIRPDDRRLKDGVIRLQAKDGGDLTLGSIERGCGQPSYGGTLELLATAEGIVVINELPVETYLCRVVPSEMPASYELEALKAQAVCARSYAYRQMESYGYPEYQAHVNDSTDYQVYGNSAAQESSTRAVEETAGQTLCYRGEIVTAYYYSTSCGHTTSLEAWGTAPNGQNQYLQSVHVGDGKEDYEKDLPWYRWEAKIPIRVLSDLAGLNLRQDLGMLTDVEVTRRGPGDVALAVTFTGEKGSAVVETENKIRRAFGGSGYEITRQDGTSAASGSLLPSAFFTVEKNGDTFVVRGGGYGHGIGMSQNGANEMAKKGKSCQEILQLFYQGTEIVSN